MPLTHNPTDPSLAHNPTNPSLAHNPTNSLFAPHDDSSLLMAVELRTQLVTVFVQISRLLDFEDSIFLVCDRMNNAASVEQFEGALTLIENEELSSVMTIDEYD